MKAQVKMIIKTIEEKQQKQVENTAEMSRLSDESKSLKVEIADHKSDLKVLVKWLEEKDRTELGLDALLASEGKKQTFPAMMKDLLGKQKKAVSYQTLYDLVLKQVPDMTFADFSTKVRVQIKAGKVLKTEPEGAKNSREHILALVQG